MFEYLKQLKLNFYDDRETRRAVWGGEYEPKSSPIKILDLGAHKGIATEYFAKTFPDAIIHAYEPNAHLYAKLVRRARRFKNVRTYNEAISGHDGSLDFFVSSRDVSSSAFGEGERVSVLCVSLRTAVERIGSPVFVKMDIEGAEFDALKDIPEEVSEIAGEVHPDKAGKSTEQFRTLLGRFKNVSISSGKSVFRAW